MTNSPHSSSYQAYWLYLALVLCLVSGVGASFIQTDGGAVEVQDLRWETPSGHRMSALLFKPATATAENPAPAVIVSHGWFNNREMQDLNFVELSRRGFVTLSIDMYGHGNSEVLPQADLFKRGIGMYDAVEMIATLPYVDTSGIGVSGHSNGAMAANLSVPVDDAAQTQLIAAVLLVDRDPVYQSGDGDYANIYGSRDVGLIHDGYDEFFFRSRDESGKVLTPPREYLSTPNAQSFLHFGAAPSTFSDVRSAGEVYTQRVGERDAVRIIYSLNQIHPWTHFSADAARDQVMFFDRVFGAPNPIEPTSQVWQIRNVFTVLGLIGFAMFLVAFARWLLQTRVFEGLRMGQVEQAAGAGAKDGNSVSGSDLAWFWGGLAALALTSGVTYILLFPVANMTQPAWLPQGPPYFIGLWAAVNGLAALLLVVLGYQLHGKGAGRNLRDLGVLPGWRNVGASAALSLTVIAGAFAIVFAVDYIFKTDFRVWVVTVKAFDFDKVVIALRYFPLFAIYFVAISIAINCTSRVVVGGREWAHTAVMAVAAAFAPIVLVIAQYTTFFQTGHTISWFPGITSIWLFPVIVYLAVSAIISRKLYRAGANPYIPGFISAGVITLIAVSNTLTMG
jgi:dienelactone hydrolase